MITCFNSNAHRNIFIIIKNIHANREKKLRFLFNYVNVQLL